MAYFQTKKICLGKFWKVLQWTMWVYLMVYFTAIGYALYPFGIFSGYLVFFPVFGMFYQEKSGNPAQNSFLRMRGKDFGETYVSIVM
jgi:hypothetical protein